MHELARSGGRRPGFDSGHSLVEIGTAAGVAAILLLIAVLRTHRIVRNGPAIAAAALSLLPLSITTVEPPPPRGRTSPTTAPIRSLSHR
jgi:hypothetical protein